MPFYGLVSLFVPLSNFKIGNYRSFLVRYLLNFLIFIYQNYYGKDIKNIYHLLSIVTFPDVLCL